MGDVVLRTVAKPLGFVGVKGRGAGACAGEHAGCGSEAAVPGGGGGALGPSGRMDS